LDVRTGESIELHYELAGVGSRFLAVALDLAIQIGVLILVIITISIANNSSRFIGRLVSSSAGHQVEAVFYAMLSIAGFVLFFGYFIIFELWWSGRTPGKRALGLRVVRDAGFPLDVGASVIRNLVRVVEVALGFYTVSAICALLSRENKRPGDYAAGTIVIRDRRFVSEDIDAYMAREAPDDGISNTDRELIERYVARRKQLEPGARRMLATQIAGRVRPQLKAPFTHLTDEELLDHLGR
jgi:uncharacterized RDD family membrane protein YckC